MKSRKTEKVADNVQACRWCGRTGPVATAEDNIDYDTILAVSNKDYTVHPPSVRRFYVCYECRLWENAIEERCHQMFGVCLDRIRAAAMKRYLDQGRWLPIRDFNEIVRKER